MRTGGELDPHVNSIHLIGGAISLEYYSDAKPYLAFLPTSELQQLQTLISNFMIYFSRINIPPLC